MQSTAAARRRHARRAGPITRLLPTSSAHVPVDTVGPARAVQALLELRSEHPPARRGIHQRSRNHMQERLLSLAPATDGIRQVSGVRGLPVSTMTR